MSSSNREPKQGWRVWGSDRCDHCCNGDRCDDPTHLERQYCPYCLGTGDALWLRQRGGSDERDIVIYKGSRQFVVDVIKDLEKRLDALEGDDGEKGKAMSNEREAWAHERIWLQREAGEGGSHTWCEDSIDDCEQAEYVRVDVASRQSADDEFKNFHRLLCERFGYSHDEKHWKRDQLSLIEWIAARQSAGANESTLRVLSSHAIRKHEGVTIFGDPAQVLKVMAAIESAGATGHEPVTRNEAPKEMLERMHREFKLMGPFEQRAFLECVYSAAPIGGNGAKAHEFMATRTASGPELHAALAASQPAGGSGSAAWDYGNRLVNAKLDPSYAQPSNEPIPQHLEGQSYDAWDAFQKHPESQMSNSDDFWPIWRDAWDAAREQPAESKRAELTEEQWRSIQAPTGNRLFDAGVHHACVRIRALLAHTSGKGE